MDSARYLLSSFVVLAHALPRGTPGSVVWLEIIACAMRATVPFFFIAAGYFLRPARTTHAGLIVGLVLRLGPIFLFWTCAYVGLALWLGARQEAIPMASLLTGGPGFHLWFLPVLGFGLATVALSLDLLGERLTLLWCVALAIFGLTSSSYHDLAFSHGVAHRGGLGVAPLFVLLGAMLQRYRVAVSTRMAGMMTLTSLALLYGEELAISRMSGAPFISHDFTFAMLLYGGSVFLLSLSLQGRWLSPHLAALGGISLGVYVSHLAFLWVMYGHFEHHTWSGALLVALLAFLAATLFSLLASNIPILRRVTS